MLPGFSADPGHTGLDVLGHVLCHPAVDWKLMILFGENPLKMSI